MHTPAPASTDNRSAIPDWVVLLGLVMIIASDYKFRRRTLGDSLGGSLDIMVVLEIALYSGVGVALAAQHLRWDRPARATPLMVSLWVYGGILASSAIYAPFPNLAVVRAAQLLLIIAFAQVLADRAAPLQFRHFSRWFVGLMAVSILVGIAYVAPVSRYQQGRFTWLHVHTVTAASLLAVGVILGVGLLTSRPPVPRERWVTLMLVGCVGAMSGALFMTKTRGSIGGVVVGLMVYTVLRVSARRRWGVVMLMGAGLGGMLYFTLPVVENYISRGEPPASVTTLSNRTELWSIAWQDFLEKPIFGWGLTASRGLFFDAVQLGGAHNAFVNALVDGGLIGFIAWMTVLVMLAVTMYGTWKRHPSTRPQVAVCAAVLVTMLVNGITMEGLGSGAGQVFVLLCVIIAWVLTLDRTAEPRPEVPSAEASPAAEPSFAVRGR